MQRDLLSRPPCARADRHVAYFFFVFPQMPLFRSRALGFFFQGQIVYLMNAFDVCQNGGGSNAALPSGAMIADCAQLA